MDALQDRVWGLHEFVAENPDEVSFKVGETVMIVERDDQYGDGWWQGTNEKGDTGLFPFSYTTLDCELAMNAKALAMSTGSGENVQGDSGSKQEHSQQPGVMKTTMADLDQALTELQRGRNASVDEGESVSGAPDRGVRRSFQSERTADLSVDDHTDGGDGYGQGEGEYQSRANARAALAANAKANATSQLEKERAEQERMRSQAERLFEEEEARQRDMLLKKEQERKQAAAKGELDTTKESISKVAPIEGVDMSDESDSEGSVNGLDAYPSQAAATHSPLFGMQDRSKFPTPEATLAQQQSHTIQENSTAKVPTFTSPFVPSTSASHSQDGNAKEKPYAEPSPVTIPTAPEQKLESAISNSRLSSVLSPVSEYEAPPYPKKMTTSAHKDASPVPRSAAATASQYEAPPYPGFAANEGVSPLASGGANGASAATPAAYTLPGPTDSSAEYDRAVRERANAQRFSAGSAPHPVSPTQFDSASGSGTQTAATSLTGGRDTPKSIAVPAAPASAGSPAPSLAAVRPAIPPGDPHDWAVEQVVEWARSRGWDENSVVNKFLEHEISGDVLLEMDINILKEIDISAFGKRFQVANAIKELKGGSGRSTIQGAGLSNSSGPRASYGYAASSSNSTRTPSETHMMPNHDLQPASQASMLAAAAGGHAAYGGWANGGATGIGMGPPPILEPAASINALGQPRNVSFDHNPQYNTSATNMYDSLRSVTPRSREVTATSTTSSVPSADPQPPGGFSSPGGPRKKTLSELADEALIKRNVSGSVAQSPPASGFSDNAGSPSRKRDSGFNKQPGSGERASFFAGINQRIRRGGSGPGAAGGAAAHNKGARGPSNSELKTQISLPTGIPTFDSAGDTARREDVMQTNGFSGLSGVTGAQSPPQDAKFDASAVDQGEGPVMARIRPVDLEGWMKKKGERYNSWKPRYLALKGNDLVILRDPLAPKIKGYVSMKGYKVIADENTNPGKYGFKILHATEKPHYFSSDDPILVREWMKGLMKATIGRDHSFPVISSYNNATISLAEAQRMNPPPRPPSPLSRARTQKAKVRQDTTQLTAKDAAVLSSIPAAGPALGQEFKST